MLPSVLGFWTGWGEHTGTLSPIDVGQNSRLEFGLEGLFFEWERRASS